ncbi:replication protein RepA [Pararhodospirillum oryzae]|uniref:Plasmid encoded RepA protein n=1 Tax=Pararhodospirillum oryzae TaxID=478448 RepID=A0A512H7U4_9PROT|nr:replication protein RepA [Pararhodospirillum oryzae]GEO81526.1 plasmid encoded RepA protein [Pararhodospirillum oryzae]
MAEIHDLILRDGRDALKTAATTSLERQELDIAAEVMSDEETNIGITHAGFALTCLPHKKTDAEVWRRENGRVTLLVKPGFNRAGLPVGLPYGSRARMILLYLQTEALKTGSPEVELGGSMAAWMNRMGISVGGKSYRLIDEQATRLSMCSLTFFWDDKGGELFKNTNFVEGGLCLTEMSDNGRQKRLWTETARLSDDFFRSLKHHAVPVLESAVRALANRSLALDIYIWLAYRLHVLHHPTAVSWTALRGQFGAGFDDKAPMSQFRRTFLESQRLAVAAYPEARVEIDGQKGVILNPCRPPIAPRMIQVLLPEV